MDQERIEKIVNSIIGPQPGLYIPAGYKRETYRLGGRIGVFYRYSDILDAEDYSQKVQETTSQLPLEHALFGFAAINNALLISPFDRAVHRHLHSIYVRPDYLERLDRFSDEHPGPDAQLLFHRANCLANLKSLLMLPDRIGCIDPQLIGDLVLLMNEFMTGHQFGSDDSQPDELDFIVEFVPVWELYNTVDVAYGISRIALMIDELCGTNPDVKRPREALGIDPDKLKFDGLPLGVYQAVIFGLFSHIPSSNAEAILKNPGICALDSSQFLDKVNLPSEYLNTFLGQRSLTAEEFRERLTDSGSVDLPTLLEDQNFTNDFTIFKQYPIIRINRNRYLILDHRFLVEQLVYGVYWQIFDSLKGQKREDFSNLWGQLVEHYVQALLADVYGASPMSPLRKNITYQGGEVDALLDFGNSVILFECKASLLSRSAKYERDRAVFQEEIRKKFVENEHGKPKALRQLANATAAARAGQLQTSKQDAHIYPVLLTYEPALASHFVNGYLDSLFQQELSKNDSKTWPVAVMTLDEFEEILPYFKEGDWSWPEFFGDRFGDHRRVPAHSAHQTLYDFRDKNPEIPRRRNEVLLEAFTKVYDSIIERYRGA